MSLRILGGLVLFLLFMTVSSFTKTMLHFLSTSCKDLEFSYTSIFLLLDLFIGVLYGVLLCLICGKDPQEPEEIQNVSKA